MWAIEGSMLCYAWAAGEEGSGSKRSHEQSLNRRVGRIDRGLKMLNQLMCRALLPTGEPYLLPLLMCTDELINLVEDGVIEEVILVFVHWEPSAGRRSGGYKATSQQKPGRQVGTCGR